MDTIIKILERYGTVYMQGLAGTLWLAAITVVLGTAVGTLLAVLRLSRVRVFQWFVKAYVWVLRGTPILLQLYFFWIFLPKVMPFSLSDTACIIVALIIIFGVGGMQVSIGGFKLAGIGLAAITGVVLNLLLPQDDPQG